MFNLLNLLILLVIYEKHMRKKINSGFLDKLIFYFCNSSAKMFFNYLKKSVVRDKGICVNEEVS